MRAWDPHGSVCHRTSTAGRGKRIPRTHWPCSLAKTLSPRFSERHFSRNKVEIYTSRCLSASGTHTLTSHPHQSPRVVKRLPLKPRLHKHSPIPLESDFGSCDFIGGLVFANLPSLLPTGLQLHTCPHRYVFTYKTLVKKIVVSCSVKWGPCRCLLSTFCQSQNRHGLWWLGRL